MIGQVGTILDSHLQLVVRWQEYVAALASCSSAHLAPQYDDCSELLTELAFVRYNREIMCG